MAFNKMRTDLLPDDVIPPGMFTFCSRCGSIVTDEASDFMCLGCTKALFGGNISREAIDEERNRSEIIRNTRNHVGASLSEHLSPLWWVKKHGE